MRKREERLTERKKNIIADLIRAYNIQSAEDIQDTLKDLLRGTIESMLVAETDNHLGYSPYDRTDVKNACKGKKQTDISSIEDKIIVMYAKGLTTRQISEHRNKSKIQFPKEFRQVIFKKRRLIETINSQLSEQSNISY